MLGEHTADHVFIEVDSEPINGGKTNRYYLNRYRKDMGLEPLIGIPAASPPETDSELLIPWKLGDTKY